MTAIEQLRDEIANLHLLADRLARKQPNDEKPKVDLPTLEECEALYHEVRGSAVSFEPWKEGIAAVRALCLSRAPSPSVDIEGIVSWLKERSATPGADIEDVERVIRIKLAQYIKAAPSPSRAPRPSPQPSVEDVEAVVRRFRSEWRACDFVSPSVANMIEDVLRRALSAMPASEATKPAPDAPKPASEKEGK